MQLVPLFPLFRGQKNKMRIEAFCAPNMRVFHLRIGFVVYITGVIFLDKYMFNLII